MTTSLARFLLATTAVLMLAGGSADATVNWENQGYSAGIDGFNPQERTISPSNVANLTLAWQSNTSDINGVYAMVEDNGTVFVSSMDQNGKPDVVALNGSTGAELWKVETGYYGTTDVSPAGLAAGAGRIFTACGNDSTDTVLGPCAYSQKTGKLLWLDNFMNPGVTRNGTITRPTYSGGVAYYGINMCAIADCDIFYAINDRTGAVIWGADPPANELDGSYGAGSAAISAGNGLMATVCAYQFDGNLAKNFFGLCTFASSSGAGGWQSGEVNTTDQQEGGAGVSISGSTVFFQYSSADLDENVMTAFDAATGNAKWTFNSVFSSHDGVQPTVAKNVVYWPDGNGTLWALKEKTGGTLWSNSNWGSFCSPVGGANGTESQPQEVNGVVFITTACQQTGSNYVTNFALASSNGNVLWQDAEGFNTIPINTSGAAPMIVNGELYADCVNVCAYTLSGGSAKQRR